jgi:hypothetical protein
MESGIQLSLRWPSFLPPPSELIFHFSQRGINNTTFALPPLLIVSPFHHFEHRKRATEEAFSFMINSC